MSKNSYRGRFAPSPTGDLHFGSLVAALISYIQAKTHDGVWLLRIEDIDETRTVTGADQAIIKTLANFGMHADEPVMYQTDPERQVAYQAALDHLTQSGLTYPCVCTRKKLAGSEAYPGFCRDQIIDYSQPHSIRLATGNEDYEFDDFWQGHQLQNIAKQSGDFNIKRKDGLFCYMLAVVIDDASQEITEVVRGIDIMDSTARQMHLIKLLKLPQPTYAHFPIITHNRLKLSKQNHAKAISHEDPYSLTHLALSLLGQEPPQLQQKTQSNLLNWAIENWQPKKLNNLAEINY